MLSYTTTSVCAFALIRFVSYIENHMLQRISVEQALAHPYFENLHEPAEEPTCPNQFDFSFENGTHMVVWVRVRMWFESGSGCGLVFFFMVQTLTINLTLTPA